VHLDDTAVSHLALLKFIQLTPEFTLWIIFVIYLQIRHTVELLQVKQPLSQEVQLLLEFT
jgi:hypothetical protein